MLVALGLDQHIENLALGVDGAPQINHPPIDFQMPSRMRFRTALAQMRGDHRTEVVHPAAHGLVRDRDLPLGEQILNVTKAECEPEIEPNRLMYDLGREPISGVADFPHTLGYCAYIQPTSCRRRDKAGQCLAKQQLWKRKFAARDFRPHEPFTRGADGKMDSADRLL